MVRRLICIALWHLYYMYNYLVMMTFNFEGARNISIAWMNWEVGVQ